MKKDRYRRLTILCTALIAVPAFGFFILQGNGFFTIVDDFNSQQIPFSAAAWEGIHAGGGDWYWGLDLGSSFVNAFGFYNLGSPFFWIYLLLPKISFPWLVGWLYMLKYIVAGLTAYCWLSRFTQKKTAVVGALLYAFSGFQTTNLEFYHFHDVVAFFPLLLIGAEQLMQERKPAFFVFSVFLNCLVNYFFFIQEVVFLVFYVLFRLIGRKKWKEVAGDGLRFLVCGALGVGMAAVLFFPGVLYVLGSSRGQNPLRLSKFFFSFPVFLHVLKGMLLPGDVMPSLSAVLLQNWKSTACYLPLFGLSFVFAFLMGKKTGWLKGLLILLLVFSLFRVTNSLFLLFADDYQRWWYMLILMMALATAKVLDSPEDYPVRKGTLLYLAVTTLFVIGVWFLSRGDTSEVLLISPRRFLLFYLIAAGGAVVLLLLPKVRKAQYPILLTATAIWCLGTTMLTLQYYRFCEDVSGISDVRNAFHAAMEFHDLDEQYRYNSSVNILLLPNNVAGVGSFTSTAENSAYNFSALFDKASFFHTDKRNQVPYVAELTGGKYRIDEESEVEPVLYTAEGPDGTYTVSEQIACPIGFWADCFLTKEELKSLPPEHRAIALMNAILVTEEDAESVGKELSPADLTRIDYENPEESIRRTADRAVKDFARDAGGFRCRTDWQETRYVYFTVPWDSGWTATIDDVPTEILYSGGMMALRVPAGGHAVEFSYHTPGLREGWIVSACSFVLFAGVLFFTGKSKKAESP